MKATDRHKLIDRINTLEGLTDDERSALLGLLREHKTYGLVWEDKPEEVEERLRTELPVLVEVKDRALTDAGPDAPNHILIEGDNLEALTTLAYTHAGKIDVIYIDPPYNTGNKDFIYNDSYVDSEDSYRHSKWLSFMSCRLRIAKKLLSERGVIFISIDNNEFANLKLLCDEIFKESNFIEMLKWKRKKQPSFLAKHTASVMEYVLVYARNFSLLDKLSIDTVSDSTKKVLNIANQVCTRFVGKGIRVKLPGKGVIKAGEYINKTLSVTFNQDIFYADGRTLNDVEMTGKFADNQKRMNQFVREDLIFITANYGLRRDVSEEEKNKRKSITDMLVDWGDNQESEIEQKDIFGVRPFDYAKPTRLIFNLVKSFNSRETSVLDFFAGSGTTLHAVMQLNAEDGGKRQCILCTNNENGICENVTYERNKRVINGYRKPNGEDVEGLHDNNLRYYRTDYVERSRSTKNMRRLVQLATDMLCIKENLYTEQKTFAGLPTYKNIYRYFEHGERKMLVIYDERYVDEIVKMISTVETNTKIKVYVFSPSEDPWEACFEPVNEKVELCALPQAIYNAYKRILPKPRQITIAPTEKEDAFTIIEEEKDGLFAMKGGDE